MMSAEDPASGLLLLRIHEQHTCVCLYPLLRVAETGMNPRLTLALKQDRVATVRARANSKLVNRVWCVVGDHTSAGYGSSAEPDLDVLPVCWEALKNNCRTRPRLARRWWVEPGAREARAGAAAQERARDASDDCDETQTTSHRASPSGDGSRSDTAPSRGVGYAATTSGLQRVSRGPSGRIRQNGAEQRRRSRCVDGGSASRLQADSRRRRSTLLRSLPLGYLGQVAPQHAKSERHRHRLLGIPHSVSHVREHRCSRLVHDPLLASHTAWPLQDHLFATTAISSPRDPVRRSSGALTPGAKGTMQRLSSGLDWTRRPEVPSVPGVVRCRLVLPTILK